MSLHKDLIGPSVRNGQLTDHHATASIDDPAEHLLHRDLSPFVETNTPTEIDHH
jgi:hypothetical protein